MRFSIMLLIALAGFSGCAQKGTFDMFKMDEEHAKVVEQLRTGAIIKSFETKALISAVYLNPIYPEQYNNGEFFVAAVYYERDSRDVKRWDMSTHGYAMTLNEKSPTLIEELQESDPRRGLIPIQNNWNKYYFIRFDSLPAASLTLLLENNQTGSVALSYQKGK